MTNVLIFIYVCWALIIFSHLFLLMFYICNHIICKFFPAFIQLVSLSLFNSISSAMISNSIRADIPCLFLTLPWQFPSLIFKCGVCGSLMVHTFSKGKKASSISGLLRYFVMRNIGFYWLLVLHVLRGSYYSCAQIYPYFPMLSHI
jgi:ABC-type transport system involved in cytochrome c biogenesis permease component